MTIGRKSVFDPGRGTAGVQPDQCHRCSRSARILAISLPCRHTFDCVRSDDIAPLFYVPSATTDEHLPILQRQLGQSSRARNARSHTLNPGSTTVFLRSRLPQLSPITALDFWKSLSVATTIATKYSTKMTRESVETVRGNPKVVIPIPSETFQVPVTSPGNLQSPLEFWIQTEKTPLLMAPPLKKKPLPPSDTVIQREDSRTPDESGNKQISPEEQEPERETSWSIACQVFIPFIIAGFGTVGAGILLDDVQDWTVFQTVPEMFVLVPALLGLKGNLEMTLASRISTQANLGLIDSAKEQWRIALGNLALLQCQSLVLGFLASMIASVVGWAREGEVNIHNVLLLTSSSMVTAAAASLLLGSVTIFVVISSRKFNINPDNVAAPLSASLGDVVTLALLASIASLQFSVAEHNDHYLWVEGTVVVFSLTVLIPAWAFFSHRCPYTRQVLYSGWVPVISAVAISSGGGYILNFAVAAFKGIAACQPVINGVGGNLVAVQACRISTYLHQRATPGIMPVSENEEENQLCVSPFAAWFGKSAHARTARILMMMAVPGHLLFITCVHYLKSDYTPMTVEFLMLYLCAAIVQVSLLLYIAHCLVQWLWKFGFDPDDSAIPYLTALGDLLGTALLYFAFLALDTL